MLESFTTNNFTYKKLTEAEQNQRGILGRLTGIIADSENPTRNNRRYSKQLWENVFNNDIIKEKIANRCLFGELGHPVDREEVDPEKIAICLAEQPKISKDGKIYGIFDILSTPCGKILKTLCDYGCKIGVSSRGTGDLIPGDDGEDEVDPSTYVCECWDAVLVPAISTARMTTVNESLNKKGSLKMALTEALNKASADDRKVMEEALEEIGLNEEEELEEDAMTNPNQVQDKKEEVKDDESRSDTDSKEVVDDKSEDPKKENPELVAEFQEALKKSKKLEADNLSLKEQLSVCRAKEVELKESLAKYKKATSALSDSAKKVKALKEELEAKDKLLESKSNQIKQMKVESRNLERITESKLNRSAAKLNNSSEKMEEMDKQIKKLTESLDNLSKQLDDTNSLLNKYRNSYKNLKEHYLEVKANSCGIQKEEVLSKLNESYKVKDIDNLCEELGEIRRNLSKLPFAINESTKIKVKPSKEFINGSTQDYMKDDYVSDDLLRLANLK